MTLTEIKRSLDALLWERDLQSMPAWQSSGIFLLRIFTAVARDIAGGLPTLRAMSLVYTTLLSLVPLIAVSFSVLKGFGVHNQIEPLLLNLLAPLGDQGEEITTQILGFVDNIKVGVLGSLGLGLLIYTVISLIKKIESAFNHTWHISSYRSIAQRFTDYLSVIMVGPVLVFTAIGITATISHSSVIESIASIEPFGSMLALFSKTLPYILVIAAFTFIYMMIPNTRVRFRSALYGAVVAGLMWETTGWLFAKFVANSTNYTAVYSSFAILIVFMIWLYLSWMILLTGASVSYYHQNPRQITNRHQVLILSSRLREKLALLVMYHIADSFHHNKPHWTADTLATQLDVASEALGTILDSLEKAAIIVRSGDKLEEFMPERSLEHISLAEIMDVVRAAEENAYLNPDNLQSNLTVDNITRQINDSYTKALDNKSLLDLIQ